jgi:ferredoxin
MYRVHAGTLLCFSLKTPQEPNSRLTSHPNQCTTAAPASFQMLEHNGRARTFVQRKSPDVKTAVASCPADCMHYVSYEELLELERARDDGVSSGVIANDHRHFGHSETRGYVAPTPLHVSRREMYTNHRDSYYQ